MKKLIALILVLTLALTLCACGTSAEETLQTTAAPSESKELVMGTLTRLNLTEEEYRDWKQSKMIGLPYLKEQGAYHSEKDLSNAPEISRVIFFDTLDAMLMALEARDISAAEVPQCTAAYLCAHNDRLAAIGTYDLSVADDFTKRVANRMGTGYAFLTTEDKAALRDELDAALTEMKADGMLDALIQSYITDAVSGEPEPVEFTKTDGETIRVAVTGALPPMDYVAADGTPAGFNTAILAELGRRMNVNFELVQVDSVGRAAALASGRVDLVFWTTSVNERSPAAGKTDEEFATYVDEQRAKSSEDQSQLMQAIGKGIDLERKKVSDLSDGTIKTQTYYSDFLVAVALK